MRRNFVLVYRIIFLVICYFGLHLAFKGNRNVFMGTGTTLSYYTIQSNIAVLILASILLIKSIMELIKGKKISEKILCIFKFVIMTDITITFLAFWILLAPNDTINYLISPVNLCVHTTTPLMCIFDFFLFDREFKMKMKHTFITAIFPFTYLIYAIVRGMISDTAIFHGSKYPYWFIDVDKYGLFTLSRGIGVFYWIIIFCLAIWFLGLFYYWLNNKIDNIKIRDKLQPIEEDRVAV